MKVIANAILLNYLKKNLLRRQEYVRAASPTGEGEGEGEGRGQLCIPINKFKGFSKDVVFKSALLLSETLRERVTLEYSLTLTPVAYGGRPSCSAGSLRVSKYIFSLFFINEFRGFKPYGRRADH